MTYDNKFVPKSPEQYRKEYMETPFWLAKFGPGSQFTVVEDLPRNKPMRYYMKPSQRGGPAYASNLIKITDGLVTKDLDLSITSAQLLFIALPGPEVVQNLKGCTFANDNGKWIFVGQTTPDMALNNPASSATEAPTTIGNMVKMLHQAIEGNVNSGIKNTPEKVIEIADKIKPGDALGLIAAAKEAGWICEVGGVIRGT